MHRVPRLDGGTSQSEFVRWALASAYLMFAAAGLLFAVSRNVPEVYGASGVWMAFLLTAGGLVSALGSATRHWAGEFIGGPAVATALMVLGLEAWLVSHGAQPFVAFANLGLLFGTATVVLARWRVTLAVYRMAHADALRRKRQGNG